MFESTAANEAEAAFGAGHLSTEISVVDAVLWACDLSEDETEVGDLVDAALQRIDVRVLRDPALATEPLEPATEPLP